MATITRAGQPLFYEALGRGPALVFLHSFLCDGSLFRHQVSALQDRFRILNIDLRGHGRSGPSDTPFTLYDLVDDVNAVLDAENVRSAVWIGLSIGGFIAMRAAVASPARVRAMVLMDTEAGPQSVPKKLQDVMLKAALRTLGPRRMAKAIVPAFLGRSTRAQQPALCQEYEERFASLRVASICRGIDAVTSRDDMLERLGEVRCPTLVLVGEEDEPLPPAKSRLIAEGIRGAELVVVPQAGHLSAVEQPQAVNAALLRFLDQLPATAAEPR